MNTTHAAQPWLANLPKHWEVKKLKYIADYINRGSTPSYTEKSDIIVINQAAFSSGIIDPKKFKFQTPCDISNLKGRLFPNDILLASTGGGVLGKSILFTLSGNYVADSHVTIIRDNKNVFIPAYLAYFFSIHFKLIEGYLGQGATNQTELQKDWLKDFILPVPPLPSKTLLYPI